MSQLPWEMDWTAAGTPQQSGDLAERLLGPGPSRVFAGQDRARPWQDGSVQQMPAPPVGQDARPPWEMDWPDAAPQQQAAPQMPWEMDWSSHEAAQPAPRQQAPSGLWNNLTAGANDAIYSTLGAPVDLASWVVRQGVHGVNAVAGTDFTGPRDLPGGSASIARAFEGIGVHDPAKVKATSTEEKLARAAGAGAGATIAPEAMLAGLGRAGMVGDGAMNMLGQVFGRSASAGDVAVNAGVGAASGIGAQMAGQVLPEQYRPLGEAIGGMLGGAAGVGAVAAGRGAAQMPQAWRDFRLSGLPEQERVAGQRLWDAASDPHAVREGLDQPRPQLVEGSQPTTFQHTGDMGLGGLERASATQFPEAFNQRRADQNAARVGALQGIQPGGAPEQVAQALRQNLADLDASTTQAVEAATNRAREAAGRLGGEGVPEGYGAAIRQQIMDARTMAKEREGALWRAVDPDGSLNLPATGVRDAARSIVQGMEKSAAPLAGEEAATIGTALQYPEVVPFREMTALRSRVSEAMRQELSTNGQTRVYARLSQLRGAIERDIETAVTHKAAMEERAVQAGMMSEEDTMAVALWRKTQDWYGDKARAEGLGQSAATSDGGYATGGSRGFRPVSGGGSQARGQSGVSPRDQGVQGSGLFPSGLQPNFDAGAAGRLKAASEATKQRAQTFDAGRVGDATRRSGASGPFQMEASVVPGRFFVPGPRGFEAMQALRNASPQSMAQIQDYAISTLRKAAQNPLDGTLDPAKVQAWRHKHADALRAMPEVDRMLADPVRATEALAHIAATRKQQMDAFQQGAVARLLNLDDPADVTRTVGGIFSRQDAVQQMARLARETAGNAEARNGLRKAMADYIGKRFIGNTEGGTSNVDMMRSDTFQQFMRGSPRRP